VSLRRGQIVTLFVVLHSADLARAVVRGHDGTVVGPDLSSGRESYAAAEWLDAMDQLSRADEAAPLGPADLELLGTAAYMLGGDAAYAACLERAHYGHLAAGDRARAARCAFWIGHNRLFRGDPVQANGWFARAKRVLGEVECVESGYQLIPAWLAAMARGDFEGGYRAAAQVAAIGERFGDADLTWLARDDQGRALLSLGRVEEGRSLVDEAMIVATSGELSPIVTGIAPLRLSDSAKRLLPPGPVQATRGRAASSAWRISRTRRPRNAKRSRSRASIASTAVLPARLAAALSCAVPRSAHCVKATPSTLVRSRKLAVGSLMTPPSVNASTSVSRGVPTLVSRHARKPARVSDTGTRRLAADSGDCRSPPEPHLGPWRETPLGSGRLARRRASEG